MKIITFTLLLIFTTIILKAHDGDVLTVENVSISKLENQLIIDFDLNNFLEMPLHDVEIEVINNGAVVYAKTFDNILRDKLQKKQLVLAGDVSNISEDFFQIKISKILGKKHDWDIWQDNYLEGPQAQYDNVGKYEIFADAPYRMKIKDNTNNPNPIPVSFILHDGIPLEYVIGINPAVKEYPWLEYINIYVKKATESDFGGPITFNDFTDNEFNNLFTAKSVTDVDYKQKAFDASIPTKDANHTIVFMEEFNVPKNINYTPLSVFLWYANINLPASVLDSKGFTADDDLDIRVQFSVWEYAVNKREQRMFDTYLRIFREEESLPKLNRWYRGDTHLHTAYSHNVGEQGLPLAPTKEAAINIGLDWITTTDHTTDFDNYRNRDIDENWAALGAEVNALNAEDQSMIYIRGQEASLNNSARKVVHFLGYPSPDDPTNGVFLGDGGGDQPLVSNTSKWITGALKELTETGGFAYGSHPLSISDDLGAAVGGGLWNLGDDEFPVNGETMPISGGEVGANDPNAPSDIYENKDKSKFIKDALKGGQIWNVRNTLEAADNPNDPYNMTGNSTSFEVIEETDEGFHINRFREGQEIINFINQKGMRLKNIDDGLQNWKFYFCAGSDAHGSFNYSNTGFIGTILFDIGGNTGDNAVGKISTLTYCPDGMGPNGENVLKALRDGNITLSDGPILVQGISTDGANTTNEVIMGEDATVDVADTGDVYINLEYVTTAEFGNVTSVTVIIGTEKGEVALEVPGGELVALNNQFSYSLNDLLNKLIEQDVNGILSSEDLINKYFYLRQELQTSVEYGLNSTHVHTSDKFHSFTNPIWLKIEDGISTPLSENQILELSTSIYPNPARNEINISSTAVIDAAIVYDMMGRHVKTGLIDQKVDVSMLAPGAYVMEIKSGKAVARKQFLKQ